MISIISPIYNEAENLDELYERVVAALKDTKEDFEFILVDNGSSDRSLEIIRRLREKDRRIKYVSLSRNFGHQGAVLAGLAHSRGDAVITLDGDLQHPPELIPELLKKWESGAEVVNTIRKESVGIGIFKKLSAKFFYWLMNRITSIDFQENSADFRLLDKNVVENIREMKEHVRFLRGLISWIGYKQEFVLYQADPRLRGKSKYSFFRMVSFAIDGITSFSSFPLRAATYFGFIIAFFSFIYIVYAVYLRLLNQTIPGWASVFPLDLPHALC